jgi:hypothetical protein
LRLPPSAEGEVEMLGRRTARPSGSGSGCAFHEAGVDRASPRGRCDALRGKCPRRLPVDEVTYLMGLTETADAKVRTLAGGQRVTSGTRHNRAYDPAIGRLLTEACQIRT